MSEDTIEDTRAQPVWEKEPAIGSGMRQSTSAAAYDAEVSADHDPPRSWSTRRVPAAGAALVLLAVVGPLLYDLTAVRAGRPASAWRRWLADTLATRALDDPWVRVAALAAVLAGTALLLAALAPGRRARLSMSQPGSDVRAELERAAAARVLRERAMAVPGVRSVRVTAGRHRITARARTHSPDLDGVRGDLETALEEGIRQLGLARQPGLSVRVQRPARG